MRRTWALGSAAVGSALVGYAAASFLLDLGGEDVSEALGGLALILGVFLLAEGLLSLRRLSALGVGAKGRSPK
ncbi:MAG: hypothetical protein ACT4OI_07350 [Methanobacteriota archaeon]